MDKTPFSKRIEILSDALEEFGDADNWKAFFTEWDLGFILAMSSHYNLADLKEGGEKYVNQSWDAFCETLLIDSHGEYDGLDKMLEFAGE